MLIGKQQETATVLGYTLNYYCNVKDCNRWKVPSAFLNINNLPSHRHSALFLHSSSKDSIKVSIPVWDKLLLVGNFCKHIGMFSFCPSKSEKPFSMFKPEHSSLYVNTKSKAYIVPVFLYFKYALEGLWSRWILNVLVLWDVGLFAVLIWIYRVIKTQPPPNQRSTGAYVTRMNIIKATAAMHATATWPLVTRENITNWNNKLCLGKF